MKMAQVKILVKGIHEKKENKIYVGSTVTLVRTDKIIIVDTGGFQDREKIIEGLKKENLSPEDIEIVILTHLHLDHLANINLFKRAKIFLKFKGAGFQYPGQFHVPAQGYLERFEIKDGTKIAEDVELILAPGHSNDMISVIVKTLQGKIVIAGDAFPSAEWVDLGKKADPALVDVEEFDKSRKKILKIADYIIPGHGDIFKVSK